jgi:uncharacterized protein YbcI
LENSISLFLSFVFSIGLIGGFSYLLFDSQKEFLEFKKYETVFTSEINSAKVQCQICELTKDGWFSQHEKQTHTIELLQKLIDQKAEQTLSPDFSAEVRTWCITSLMQLSSEKGRIGGYLPDDELVLKYQQAILANYEQEIFVVNEMKSMVLYWENETLSQRDVRIENINSAILNLTSSLQSLLSISEQIVARYDQEEIELEQKFNEFDRLYKSIQTKRFLAVAGILVGLVIFLTVSISAYKRYNLNSSETPKPKAPKKDKSLKK